jgi:hypothetical protein
MAFNDSATTKQGGTEAHANFQSATSKPTKAPENCFGRPQSIRNSRNSNDRPHKISCYSNGELTTTTSFMGMNIDTGYLHIFSCIELRDWIIGHMCIWLNMPGWEMGYWTCDMRNGHSVGNRT